MNIFKNLFSPIKDESAKNKNSNESANSHKIEKIIYSYEADISDIEKISLEDLNLTSNYDKEFLKQQNDKKKLIETMKAEREQPSVWLTNFLEKNRMSNEKISNEQISKMYFKLMQDQLNAMKNSEYDRAFSYAQMSLGLLERFIVFENLQFGSVEFKSVPSIDFFLRYTSVKGLIGQFQNIKEIINYFPELKLLYSDELSEYDILLDLSKQIRKIIKTNGEILQKELKKQLPNYKPKLIREACIDMALFGLLKREKIDNAHKLSLK